MLVSGFFCHYKLVNLLKYSTSTTKITQKILKFFFFQVNYLTNEYTHKVMPDSAWCAVPWNEHVNATTPFYLMISSTVVAFIIPFSLVTVLYYK